MKEIFEKLSAERCFDFGGRTIVDATNFFRNDCEFFNVKTLYLIRFGIIPNCMILHDIDSKKANKWLLQNYQDKITDCCYDEYDEKENKFHRTYYFLYDDLLIFVNNWEQVRFLYRKTDNALVEKIISEIKKFKKRSHTPEIDLLIAHSDGVSTRSLEISRPKLSIEDNYNDDFLSVHKTILKRLRKEKNKGLVLLHGKPGTGKTSYIRYLVTIVRKRVIFLPPNMAASITDPGLMNVLIDNPNSIFVIEDAENIIIDRKRTGSSSVSALLNLADGLLSDCLNIQILCTFNTDLSRVDSALTRKGRLIAKYEFTELEAHKAQALSDKLGYSTVITSPATLAAIYNQSEAEFEATSQRKTIGFQITG